MSMSLRWKKDWRSATSKSLKGKTMTFWRLCLGGSDTRRDTNQNTRGVIVERDSKDLFLVADEADSEIAKQLPKKLKTLKADEIIAQRSAIPAVSGRKRQGDISKTTDGVLSTKRQRTNYVTQKEVVHLRQLANGNHLSALQIVEADYDPWAAKDEVAEVAHSSEGKFSFLPQRSKVKAPETLKHAPISLAASGKAIPAVGKPKASFSYNPSFNDYEALLAAEGNKAVETERKRLDAVEAERIKMEAVARSAAEADEAEARADMSEWEEDSAWEGFESGVEDEALTAKRPRRKTPAQRNRINRRKEAEGKKKHDAVILRKEEQAKKIETLLAEEKAAREALATLSSSDESDDDAESGDDIVLRRRQLGKFRLPEKDLELVLPDELQESLRLLKPEGNLLKDRYRSLLVRGKVEVRRKRPFRKQAKTKVTEKWAHKDFHLF